MVPAFILSKESAKICKNVLVLGLKGVECSWITRLSVLLDERSMYETIKISGGTNMR